MLSYRVIFSLQLKDALSQKPTCTFLQQKMITRMRKIYNCILIVLLTDLMFEPMTSLPMF